MLVNKREVDRNIFNFNNALYLTDLLCFSKFNKSFFQWRKTFYGVEIEKSKSMKKEEII
jgi:hypothetical protein